MMSTDIQHKIGVGIIGASPNNPGWAVGAHIPAIRKLRDYELVAVSTSNHESAVAAAREFGVSAFDNYKELIEHPGVDLVVIAVKVPHHYEIARAAIEAGKMVYSEWPLGMNTKEAEELAKLAESAGVRTIIGLQARFSPAIRYARDLVADGYVGEVLSTALSGTALIWGPASPSKFDYIYDVNGGATMLASAGLHAIDGLIFVLGEYESLVAKLVVRHPEVTLTETGDKLQVTAPDHLAVAGTLTGGALATVLYRSGTSRDVDLRWEIVGTKGELVITADFNGNIQNTELKLKGGQGEEKSLHEIDIPERYTAILKDLPEGPARYSNIAQVYESLAEDIREGTRLTPDFAHAVKRHRLYDTIMAASRTGAEQYVDASNE